MPCSVRWQFVGSDVSRLSAHRSISLSSSPNAPHFMQGGPLVLPGQYCLIPCALAGGGQHRPCSVHWQVVVPDVSGLSAHQVISLSSSPNALQLHAGGGPVVQDLPDCCWCIGSYTITLTLAFATAGVLAPWHTFAGIVIHSSCLQDQPRHGCLREGHCRYCAHTARKSAFAQVLTGKPCYRV